MLLPQTFLRQLLQNKVGLTASVIIVFLITIAVFAPALSTHRPFFLSEELSAPPSEQHLMGTDILGRDIFSRVLWGSQVSLVYGLGVAGIAAVIGTTLGSLSGYYGGKTDDLFSRFLDIFIMIPRIFLVLIVVSLYGTNIVNSMLAVGILAWPTNARIMRAQVLTLKTRSYSQTSIGLGASSFHVLSRHILPNGIHPVIANSFLEMANAILLEGILSFLGMGDANLVSWGQMLRIAMDSLPSWWMAFFPGLGLMLAVLGFNFLADAIYLALNPRQKIGLKIKGN